MSIKDRLTELGITLETVPEPMGNYVHAVRTGNLLFLSGKGPRKAEGGVSTGKVGSDVTLEQGYQDARSVGITLLAVMENELGSLDNVTRIVKVLGMVNSAPDFTDHPKVINGCSDLFVEVFGDKGRHARSAVGLAALPSNITVEIEVIVEVE
jgi:enamine deaminase RidA (YjgF/YER057c/UK114 family)